MLCRLNLFTNLIIHAVNQKCDTFSNNDTLKIKL